MNERSNYRKMERKESWREEKRGMRDGGAATGVEWLYNINSQYTTTCALGDIASCQYKRPSKTLNCLQKVKISVVQNTLPSLTQIIITAGETDIGKTASNLRREDYIMTWDWENMHE